jgi:preprotein translocase subunit SecG
LITLLYVLYALFFISCIVLIGSVLLQPGKTDAGALFTSNISNAAFGPRGTASVLAKMTIVAACVFMFSALMISMPALQGNVSVLQSVGETPVESTAPADTNAAPAADANGGPGTDANAVPTGNTEAPTNANSTSNAPANQ